MFLPLGIWVYIAYLQMAHLWAWNIVHQNLGAPNQDKATLNSVPVPEEID